MSKTISVRLTKSESVFFEKTLEMLSKSLQCPFCNKPWPKRTEVKKVYAYRVSDKVHRHVTKTGIKSEYIVSVLRSMHDFCPSCGRKK